MATIHRALDLGITFFDTADMYGPYTNEQLLGRALRGHRDQAVIATKFGILRDPARPDYRGISGKPDYVRKACEGSLLRLGVDVIDVYYQHRVDPDTPIEETVDAMAELVRQGQGALPRSVRSRRGNDPPRACRSSDHGIAIRVLALDARSREGSSWRMPRAGYRFGAVQPARSRVFDRTNQAFRRSGRGRLPAKLAPIPGRKFPAQFCACEKSRRNRSREKMYPGAACPCLGARSGTRHCSDSRNQTSQIFAGKCGRA